MRTVKTMASLLLLSAVSMSPAYANWFSNPHTNTNLNIGSAPNPTPEDLRRIGDSTYSAAPRVLHSEIAPIQPVPAPVAYVTHDEHDISSAAMFRMEGKTVFGTRGARLGYILAVDHGSKMAELQTPGGIAVAMPVALMIDKGNHMSASTMSKADVTAMAKTQTGRTVAINIVKKSSRPLRG
jgi:hypothetical protein